MFSGIDRELVMGYEREDIKYEDTKLYRLYEAQTIEEKRRKIWPFLWGKFLKDKAVILGMLQIGLEFAHYELINAHLGNRAKGDSARVSNRHRISFPGYSEMFVGIAHDEKVNSNDIGQNPFSTVMEFIKTELNLEKHQIAAFGSWQVRLLPLLAFDQLVLGLICFS